MPGIATGITVTGITVTGITVTGDPRCGRLLRLTETKRPANAGRFRFESRVIGYQTAAGRLIE
jgi:hypothetical protein